MNIVQLRLNTHTHQLSYFMKPYNYIRLPFKKCWAVLWRTVQSVCSGLHSSSCQKEVLLKKKKNQTQCFCLRHVILWCQWQEMIRWSKADKRERKRECNNNHAGLSHAERFCRKQLSESSSSIDATREKAFSPTHSSASTGLSRRLLNI